MECFRYAWAMAVQWCPVQVISRREMNLTCFNMAIHICLNPWARGCALHLEQYYMICSKIRHCLDPWRTKLQDRISHPNTSVAHGLHGTGHTLLMDTLILAFLRVPREEQQPSLSFICQMVLYRLYNVYIYLYIIYIHTNIRNAPECHIIYIHTIYIYIIICLIYHHYSIYIYR